MPVAVVCPECHSRADVPAAVVGRRVKCPACHPPFVATRPKPAAKEPSFDDPPRRPSPPPPSRRLPRWLWAVGGVSVLVLAFAGAMLSSRGTPRPTPPLFVLPPPPPAVWALHRGDGFEVMLPGDQRPSQFPPPRFIFVGETVERTTATGFKYTAHSRPRAITAQLPFDPPVDPRVELDLLERAVCDSLVDFRLVERKPFVFGTAPGTQVKLDRGSEFALLRFIAAERRLVVLIVQARQPLDETTPEVAKFFPSLKLTLTQ